MMAKTIEQLTQAEPVTLEESQTGSNFDANQQDIKLAAYYRAKTRGFAPGGELEDWLDAERALRVCPSCQGRGSIEVLEREHGKHYCCMNCGHEVVLFANQRVLIIN